MLDTDISGFNAFKVLSFLASTWPPANLDEANPKGKMALWRTTLYGTAQRGGAFGNGAVFAVNTDGTGYTNLYSFTGGSDGGNPVGGLILSGATLYGTTQYGGSSGAGTVFSISLTPRLSMNHSGQNFLLTWPTSYAGFDFAGYILQSTTNLGSPVAWTADSLVPTIINGHNTITNPISGTSRFFRLRQ